MAATCPNQHTFCFKWRTRRAACEGVSCEDAQDTWAVASFYPETSKMYGENWFFQLPSGKLTWQWKSTVPNGKYIASTQMVDLIFAMLVYRTVDDSKCIIHSGELTLANINSTIWVDVFPIGSLVDLQPAMLGKTGG